MNNIFDSAFSFIGKFRGGLLMHRLDAWDWSIAHFELQDRRNFPRSDAIVFTGSSSITLWKTLERDMSPLPVINRGFGGARIEQVTYYVDRIVTPYRPRAVVLFAGSNDLAEPKSNTPEQVFDDYLSFVNAVHAELPKTPIYFISITPTPSRWNKWPEVQLANQLIYSHIKKDKRLHYIDLTDNILASDGTPDRSLFLFDRTHPSKKGYAVWTDVIKPILVNDLANNSRSRKVR